MESRRKKRRFQMFLPAMYLKVSYPVLLQLSSTVVVKSRRLWRISPQAQLSSYKYVIHSQNLFSLAIEVAADALRSMTSSSKPSNSLPTRCTVVLVLPALDSPRDHWPHWQRSRVERFWRTPGSWLSLFNWTWVILQWEDPGVQLTEWIGRLWRYWLGLCQLQCHNLSRSSQDCQWIQEARQWTIQAPWNWLRRRFRTDLASQQEEVCCGQDRWSWGKKHWG